MGSFFFNRSGGLAAIAVIALGALSGCASVTSERARTLEVETQDLGGRQVPGADCVLRNSNGEWRVHTPGRTLVAGASDSLVVRCEHKEHAPGHANVISSAKMEMFGNLIVGGVIGAVIDHSTGAGYEYPPLVSVRLGDSVVIKATRSYRDELRPRGPENPSPIAEAQQAKEKQEAGAEKDNRTDPARISQSALNGKSEAPLPSSEPRTAGRTELVPDRERSPPVPNSAPPKPSPPPVIRTDWAAMDQVESLPIATQRAREAYRAFLRSPRPRAFAVGPYGTWAFSSANAEAANAALQACQTDQGLLTCRLYAVDDQIVWSEESAAEIKAATWMPQSDEVPTARPGAIGEPGEVPYLDDRGRQRYREFLGKRSPRAFAVSSSGSFGFSYQREDAQERALQYCQRSSRHPCRLYVVNDRLVWPLANPLD